MIGHRLLAVGCSVVFAATAFSTVASHAASAAPVHATRSAGRPASSAEPAPATSPRSDDLHLRWQLPAARLGGARLAVAQGARIGATLELVADQPLRQVVVTLRPTGAVHLFEATTRSFATVAPGATIAAALAITGSTRGAINAVITGLTPAGTLVGTQAELDYAAAAGRAALSLNGSLDAQAGALGFDRPAIGNAAYQQRLAALMGSGGTENFVSSPMARPLVTPTTTKVSGTILYTASDATKHPARTILVQIRDADGTSVNGTLVSSVTTNALGQYTSTVSTKRANGTARSLFVRAVAQGTGFVIKPVAVGSLPQHVDSTPHAATGAALVISLTANNVADNNTAFDVADTLVSGVVYLKRINGGAIFKTVTATFPDPMGTDFNSGSSTARILHSDRFDWDVILHEFGHYVADNFKIDTSLGGRHSFTQNLGEPPPAGYGKTRGIALAWSEGFATWFGITAETVLNVKLLKIPHAGDTFYDDTEEALNSHDDLQTNLPTPGLGEDNELSVARILWHIEKDPTLAMSDLLILNTLKAAKTDTLSKAIAVLVPAGGASPFNDTQAVVAAKETHANVFACVATTQAVSPQITAPANGAAAASGTPRTYTWKANGAGPSNRLNKFTVQFWSGTWDKLLFQSAVLTGTTVTYTPTTADWNTIMQAVDGTGSLPKSMHVVVKGSSTNVPVTGPYKSCAISEPIARITAVAIDSSGVIASLPDTAVPSCQNNPQLPPDLNQFNLSGTGLVPSTGYTLQFSDPANGYGPVPVSGLYVTSPQGTITNQIVTIPVMPSEQHWPLIATPSGGVGPAVGTQVNINWTTCLEFDPNLTNLTIFWGGGGAKPATTVTEAWNAAAPAGSLTTSATGEYSGAYTMTCPASSNTITVSATTFDGARQLVAMGIPCNPGSGGAGANSARRTIVLTGRAGT